MPIHLVYLIFFHTNLVQSCWFIIPKRIKVVEM